MKRYKELKYSKKIYTEQYKIDEILLKEGFGWFLDCEVEDVRIEISNKHLIFNSGTYFNGTWKYGVFRDGVWKYGVWEGGVWYNGKWFNGVFQSGIIFNGKFFHGKIESGEIKGGEFYNIEIGNDVIQKNKEKPVTNDNPDENDIIPQGEKITETKMKTKYIKMFENFEKSDTVDLYGFIEKWLGKNHKDSSNIYAMLIDLMNELHIKVKNGEVKKLF